MKGIPGFREILSYSKKISNPVMTIRFDKNIRNNLKIINKIKSHLMHL